ncbi:MAG TPA: polysaccharide biosynthesis/export family protein [Rhizomicrobium sp.]|nr:polysaccharide biosynthesis/export family protein [Rhizomicrobium sp.]
MPFFPTVIACACAVMLVCARVALAQTQNDDRYGFNPVPGLMLPAQQTPLPLQQRFVPPPLPAPPQGAAQTDAPPAPNFSQNFTPPQGQLPPAGYTPPPPAQPYGFAPLPTGTDAPARYGTQMGANLNATPADYGQSGVNFYVLGPGDKLHVSVLGEDDLSGEYQIDGSGLVRLPLIGTLRAAGYTAPALEYAIAGAYAQGYLKHPQVTVEISTYRPVFIIGAVNRPGEYPYVANMTALNAVGFAGGFTNRARQSTVYVRHEGSTVEEAMPASQLTRVWPGDVVQVKTALFWDALDIF